MKTNLSGRTPESAEAIRQLIAFLERFGDVKEAQESVLTIDEREIILIAFSSQAYYAKKGYYWFSLAKTKYTQLLLWNESHAWVVLICGMHGQYFVPLGQVKDLIRKMPSNRRDGRWDLYIRFDNQQRAFFGVTHIQNHLDVTDQLQHFEQIWETPDVKEKYTDEAIYIPDSLPTPDRRTGNVIRVVRDTVQSRTVKELYDYKCQVCGWTAYVPILRNKWYCEAHHVQPLGIRYSGPDHVSNILALCPTHHCMMDLGILAIAPAGLIVLSTDHQEPSRGRKVALKREHGLNQRFLQFHLENIYLETNAEVPLSASTDLPI
jgi:hypothetical protein